MKKSEFAQLLNAFKMIAVKNCKDSCSCHSLKLNHPFDIELLFQLSLRDSEQHPEPSLFWMKQAAKALMNAAGSFKLFELGLVYVPNFFRVMIASFLLQVSIFEDSEQVILI